MYEAASGLGELDEFEPRLLVERAAGHESGVAYDLMDGRYARPRATSRSASRIRSRPRATRGSPVKVTCW